MSVTGARPAVACPIMEMALIDAQGLGKLEAISGADYSLQRFRHAQTVASTKARLAADPRLFSFVAGS